MSFRKIEPEIKTTERINLIKPQVFEITEHARLFWINQVPNETVTLDLVFDAGNIRGENSIPKIVNALLLSGTSTYNSVQIHEKIDVKGGFVNVSVSNEFVTVSINCLKEFLFPILTIVKEAIQNCAFRDEEVNDILPSLKQRLDVSMQRVNTIASVEFQKLLFCSHAEYASVSKSEDYNKAEIAEYKRFLKQYYHQGLVNINLLANLSVDEVDAIIDLFGAWAVTYKPAFKSEFVPQKGRFDFHLENKLQAAIKMGRSMVDIHHEDHVDFDIVSIILGGYFGSRLMANIREDKGYTYGIHCELRDIQAFSYFSISTEVGKGVLEPTLKEIKYEFERLQTDLIAEDELNLVRNYILGRMLQLSDSNHAMLSLYLTIYSKKLDPEYYNHYIERVKSISPQRIQEIALKYLNWDDFLIVTAG